MCWRNEIKNKIFSQPRKCYEGKKERKQLYYWINIKQEYDARHKQFTETKGNLIPRQADVTHYIPVLKKNKN